MPDFVLQGGRGLEAALERAGEEARKQVAQINRETAETIMLRARGFAPRDRGDLIRSIQMSGSGVTWRVGLVDEQITNRGGRNSAHQNPSVYGVWYEYGFVTRKIAKHPFMRPAVDSEERRFQSRLDAAVPAIERAAGSGR